MTLDNGIVKLNIQTEGEVAFSLLNYADSDFDGNIRYDARHPYDLSPLTSDTPVYAHFDYWQRGIGNKSCGGDNSIQKYFCPIGTFNYTLRFIPSVK